MTSLALAPLPTDAQVVPRGKGDPETKADQQAYGTDQDIAHKGLRGVVA